MEDGREVVTLEDISESLLKAEKAGFIVWPFFFGIMFLFFRFGDWIEDKLIFDILSIAMILLCIFFLVMDIVDIKKIKSGTYFTITTDELRRKEEHVLQIGNDVMRLYFQCDHYDITRKYSDIYMPQYQMEHRTVYDTAFIGDSFTLVKVKNTVVLAYNNKLFNVQY